MTAARRPRIAVIGANGQVGAEVCLFLHLREDVTVVPIARSAYSTSLLRRAGIACRHGSLARPEEAERVTADCDLIADFSWPRGEPERIRDFIRTNVKNAVCGSPAGSPHVFVSTQSVYRLTTDEPFYRVYARTKLHAESVVRRWGARRGRPVYVLRLGQVHGLLQSVSHDLVAEMRPEPTLVPRMDSFTVFAFTVAEALAHIALGREAPGTYTLISVPAWTWREVHAYYAERAQVTPDIVETPMPSTRSAAGRAHPRAWQSALWRIAVRHRELLDDIAHRVWPGLAERARAEYLKRRVRQELAQSPLPPWRPYLQDKAVPGRRLATLSDSRLTMRDPTRRVQELLAALTRETDR
jgi:nucleoside-diphosphate-sugar epimerase